MRRFAVRVFGRPVIEVEFGAPSEPVKPVAAKDEGERVTNTQVSRQRAFGYVPQRPRLR